MLWLLKKLGSAFGNFIIIGEYKRIKAENKQQEDYGNFIDLMNKVAKQRSVRCKADELSRECPMAIVINQMYNSDPRRTTSGTDTYRSFTVIGSDGQIINIQSYDLSQKLAFTVRHADGRVEFETVDPVEAMTMIRRDAGFAH